MWTGIGVSVTSQGTVPKYLLRRSGHWKRKVLELYVRLQPGGSPVDFDRDSPDGLLWHKVGLSWHSGKGPFYFILNFMRYASFPILLH